MGIGEPGAGALRPLALTSQPQSKDEGPDGALGKEEEDGGDGNHVGVAAGGGLREDHADKGEDEGGAGKLGHYVRCEDVMDEEALYLSHLQSEKR